MTDWRGDLLKIGIIPDDMPDQTNFVLFNLDELANHMIKELDKAREEGRREQQKLDCDLYGTSVATEGEIIKGWATDEVELKEGDIVDTPEGKRRIGKTIKLTTK